MIKDDPQLKIIYETVRKSGLQIIHAPYTPVFEDHFQPSASIDEKHQAYERLLEIDSHLPEPSRHTLLESNSRLSSETVTLPEGGARSTKAPSPTRIESLEQSLFDPAPLLPLQSWRLPPSTTLTPKQEERKNRILAALANSRLGRTEYKLASILQRYPETRNSDTALCIRYWRNFQSDILEQHKPFELEVLFDLERVEYLTRLRRLLQNTLGLFRGTARQVRAQAQGELNAYLAARANGGLPEIRFYLDETGNEGAGKRYRGVAGICVMNWKHFEIHHGALAQWRQTQQWPGTLRFSEISGASYEVAMRLLAQLQQRRGGLLFVGHAVNSRGSTAEDLCGLFIQLVVDSLRQADQLGCLNEPRILRVIKESADGFDSVYLGNLSLQLQRTVEVEFPGRLLVAPIDSAAKGSDLMLECADLIAGGMQRRALEGGRNPKDRLAEAITNVTGFEDVNDAGAVFKYHVPHANRH